MYVDGNSQEKLGTYPPLVSERYWSSFSDIGLNTGKDVFRKIIKEIPHKQFKNKTRKLKDLIIQLGKSLMETYL